MEGLLEPSFAVDTACGTHAPRKARIGLVLPSTPDVIRRTLSPGQGWLTVGRHPGSSSPASVLRQIASNEAPRSVVIFTDQLHRPADATILAVLEDRKIYLSALEFILCDRYGYTLGVWTSLEMVWLSPGASVTDVSSAIANHLRDCAKLGDAWLERDKQIIRTAEHRNTSAKRQLRFFHSSTANAYMDDPSNPLAKDLLDRIATLETPPRRDIAS